MANYDVNECAERLKPWIIRTPLVEIEVLSQRLGKRVFLKLESLQRTGAFKFRGAMNYMLTLDPQEAAKGVITASSGNHGLGMSLSGKLKGVKCTVVMPVSAPMTKQRRAKDYGANLVLHGSCYDEAQEHAKMLAEQHGYAYVPSFNHPAIIAGQGTILGEILEELPDTDMILAPVGGGGMLAGLLMAKEQLAAEVEIVGVEPEGAACMSSSLQAGELVTLKEMNTIADGVAVLTPGNLNLEVVSRFQPAMRQVSDAAILEVQELLLREAKLIVETAGAVSVAGLLSHGVPADVENVVCVISGANVDLSHLKKFCE
ncbi:MAG: threonine ammonia-lyase [Bacillota bacterium]|jgi:threonine dehydratase